MPPLSLSLDAPLNPGIEWGLSQTPLTGVRVRGGTFLAPPPDDLRNRAF